MKNMAKGKHDLISIYVNKIHATGKSLKILKRKLNFNILIVFHNIYFHLKAF